MATFRIGDRTMKVDEIPEHLRCEHVLGGSTDCGHDICYYACTRGHWYCRKRCFGHQTKCEPECFGEHGFLSGFPYSITLRKGSIWDRWCAVRKAATEALPQAGEWALEMIMDFRPVGTMHEWDMQSLVDCYRSAHGPCARVVRGPLMTDLERAEKFVNLFRWPQREHDLWSYNTL